MFGLDRPTNLYHDLCGKLFCYNIPWRLCLCCLCWNRCSRNFRFGLYIMSHVGLSSQ
uniref:Uncharacterized protein n=1 Tax=Helianthus annuus TaxID=4232 RepID=A0A251SHV0_HELAN